MKELYPTKSETQAAGGKMWYCFGMNDKFEEMMMRERERSRIDKATIESATYRHSEYVRMTLERANKIRNDHARAERLEESECVICYRPYGGSRIGGALCTTRKCGLCEAEVHSGSTNCDVLCISCAKKNRLCKHCGADVDLKMRRKKRAYECKEPL